MLRHAAAASRVDPVVGHGIRAAVDPLGDGTLINIQAEAGGAVFNIAIETVTAGVGALAVDARPQPLEEGVALVV